MIPHAPRSTLFPYTTLFRSGVGNVQVFSAQDYSMRIWLKPEKLAAYNLIPTDVMAALNEQSLEAAAGSLGEKDRKSTRVNSSHVRISYAVFCLKKKNIIWKT